MSCDLSTPNIAILGSGDLAARNIQELSPTRLSHFFAVRVCGITLLVIYSLRAEHAFIINVFDFALSLNSVRRFDSAVMKFEDGDDGPAQFLGYFHLLHARLAPYASDQVAALGTDPLLVGWSELHIS